MQNTTNTKDYFIIPNPIYDVVFKYLMEDLESAKIILSTLINEEIVDLKFEPTSYTHQVEDPETKKVIHLFHLDFKATVRLKSGELETIMIELQKAKLPSDIFRFKRYITTNFQQKHQVEVIDPQTKAVKTIDKPIRLIPIFILNFRIEKEINDLLIKTSRLKTGVFKGQNLQQKNDFIDNLTYDIWVIQLPNLAKIKPEDYKDDPYKTKLYALLKLFDQKARMTNRHRLRLIKKLFPSFLDRVIMRLKSADSNNPNLEEKMNMEDELINILEEQYNKISHLQQIAEQERKAKEKKQRQLEEKQKQLKLERKAKREKEHQLEEKQQQLELERKAKREKEHQLEEKQQQLELERKAKREKEHQLEEKQQQLELERKAKREKEHQLEEKQQQLELERKAKREKEHQLEEQQQQLELERKAKEEQQQQLEQQQEQLTQQNHIVLLFARKLKVEGMLIEQIMEMTQLPKTIIEQL